MDEVERYQAGETEYHYYKHLASQGGQNGALARRAQQRIIYGAEVFETAKNKIVEVHRSTNEAIAEYPMLEYTLRRMEVRYDLDVANIHHGYMAGDF